MGRPPRILKHGKTYTFTHAKDLLVNLLKTEIDLTVRLQLNDTLETAWNKMTQKHYCQNCNIQILYKIFEKYQGYCKRCYRSTNQKNKTAGY